MHDRVLAQQIEDLIKVAGIELELEPWNENVDLMLSALQVTIQTPSPPSTQLDLSEEWDLVPLDDDPVMDLYNMS